MGLVRMWSRQVVRAAGASLIAPLVLLVVAGVVASGGGLGGLESLGQIASGPSLPDTGLATASSSPMEDAEIVGADVPGSSEPARSARPTVQLATATPPAPAASPAEAAGARAEIELGSSTERPTGRSPLTDTGEGGIVDEPGDTSSPTGGDPVADLQETTNGLEESLSEPVGPVANELLDLLLLGPPRQ